MVKGKISHVRSVVGKFSLPARPHDAILALVYKLRKIFPLGAAAFAALAFLGGYEIATSTGVLENTLSLHTDQTTTQLGYLDGALTESAETNRAEIYPPSLVSGFSGSLPQFVAAHADFLRETHRDHQNFFTHSANPRAPPAL